MGRACAEPGAGRRPPAAHGGGQTGAARFGGGAAGPAARTVAAFPRVFVGYCGLAAFFAGACGPPPACKGIRIPALARRSPLQAAGIRPAGPAAAGGRRGGGLKARPPKTVLRTVCPAGLPRTDPPGLPHQLLPHGLQQPFFPPGDLHLRHPELPGHLGLGLAAVVPQKNQPAVPFLQIGQQLVQRKQVA